MRSTAPAASGKGDRDGQGVTPLTILTSLHPSPIQNFCLAKLMERCSDGVEDQGAEEALWGKRELSRQFWKPSPVRAALLSARNALCPADSNAEDLREVR